MRHPDRRLLAHLTDEHTSLVLMGDGGMPEIAFWGAALGPGTVDVAAFERPIVGRLRAAHRHVEFETCASAPYHHHRIIGWQLISK